MNHEVIDIVFRALAAGIIGFALGRLHKLSCNKAKNSHNNRQQRF